MKLGDHIMINRGGYMHHGIYVGDSKVVHFKGDADKKLIGVEQPIIIMESVYDFGAPDRTRVVEYDEDIKLLSVKETVSRALHKIGSTDYHLMFNNCEHFAIWCKTGRHESTQVDETLDWLADVVCQALA